MRLSRPILFSCLTLAACRSDSSSNTTPDAHVSVDAPRADAPAVDAPAVDAPAVDAAPDGSVVTDAGSGSGSGSAGGASRVWVIGDFITNNVTIAGAFDGSAALPVVPATRVPDTTTVATAALADTTGYGPHVFDVTADGAKTAFVADAQVAGRFDLYVADPNGGTPTLLVMGAANIEIAAIALSPDGTKIAYLADSTTDNGGYDLYVIPTTGTGTAVKVSPDRALADAANPNLDVQQFTWSNDSKLLAFTADLEVDKTNEVYIVDTTVATPTAKVLLGKADILATPVGSGTIGQNGVLAFDNAGRVYFRAHISATSASFQLFSGDATGARTDLTALVPTRGDASLADVGAFGVTPDGATLVFSADAPTATRYDLYKATIGGTTSTALTAIAQAGHADFFTPLAFSPDSTKVAVTASFLSARSEPFVIDLTSATPSPRRLVSVTASCTGCSSPDVNVLQWTADGTAVYATGDLLTNNDIKVFRLDPTQTDQAPTLAVDFPTNGDALNLIVRPAR